jgi:hypothetical protein
LSVRQIPDHHGAEIALLRDLYRTAGLTTPPPALGELAGLRRGTTDLGACEMRTVETTAKLVVAGAGLRMPPVVTVADPRWIEPARLVVVSRWRDA